MKKFQNYIDIQKAIFIFIYKYAILEVLHLQIDKISFE